MSIDYSVIFITEDFRPIFSPVDRRSHRDHHTRTVDDRDVALDIGESAAESNNLRVDLLYQDLASMCIEGGNTLQAEFVATYRGYKV